MLLTGAQRSLLQNARGRIELVLDQLLLQVVDLRLRPPSLLEAPLG